jgi:hypothetical protein
MNARVVAVALLLTALGAACGDDGPDEAAELATIEVIGPSETESGDVPHFEWEGIDGADEYAVVVRDADGASTWAWQGDAEDIWFGGLTRERPPGMAGPTVTAGSTWRVVAFDGDGHAVGISPERSLEP